MTCLSVRYGLIVVYAVLLTALIFRTTLTNKNVGYIVTLLIIFKAPQRVVAQISSFLAGTKIFSTYDILSEVYNDFKIPLYKRYFPVPGAESSQTWFTFYFLCSDGAPLFVD